VLLLAACQPAAAPVATNTGEPAPTNTVSEETPDDGAVESYTTETAEITPAETSGAETAEVSTQGCTVVTRRGEPTPISPFRAVDASDHISGPESAKITIIEYSDFQCPFCAQTAPVLSELEDVHSGDVRVVFRHFPLSSHDKAQLSAQAAEAAAQQGAFWEMHDLLFASQAEWSPLAEDAFRAWLADQALALELDVEQFTDDLDSQEVIERVQRDLDEASAIGLPGTPSLILNGQYYGGPSDYTNLSAIIDLIKLEDQQFTECPPVVIDLSSQYRATIQTEKGDIVIDLLVEEAPIAVNNFVFLAQNDWYDGVTFHRVVPDFVAQAGDPTGTGFGGPGYAFPNEVQAGLAFDGPGVVGMANAGPDSNGSQFFITFAAQEQLNGGYTIFGRVVEGMDVLEALTPRNPATDPGAPAGDAIMDVLIEEL
jgi:cyclophilin family peptidyl-prolyl cis-trans isomerase/protein-disulfide isomerase